MQTDIQEIYVNVIRPLTSDDKLQIAKLILEDVTGKSPFENGSQIVDAERTRIAEERFARWIGAVSSGNPHSADNEQIDADLAREYGATHDDK